VWALIRFDSRRSFSPAEMLLERRTRQKGNPEADKSLRRIDPKLDFTKEAKTKNAFGRT